MDFTSEDDITQIQSPNTQRIVPLEKFVDLDPSAELFFETPPPDDVRPVSSTFENRDASSHKTPSDSDSGESLFLTQSVTSAVRTVRRRKSTDRPESIANDDSSEESERNSRRGSEDQATESEEGSGGHRQHTELPKKGKSSGPSGSKHIQHPKRALFPFLLKQKRRQRLSLKKHQILEDKAVFVPKFNTRPTQTWRPQSILKRRKAVMPSSQVPDLLQPIEHVEDEKHIKNASMMIVKRKTNASSKLKNTSHLPQTQKNAMNEFSQSKKKCKAAAKKHSVCSSKSLSVPLLKEPEVQQILSELSDSAHLRQPLIQQIISSAVNSGVKASDGGHLWVIEETQRLNSVEAFTEAATDMMQVRSRAQSNSCSPPQGGDISVHNDTQYTDDNSEIGSLDLYMPLDNVIKVKKTDRLDKFVSAEVAVCASSTKHSESQETSQNSVEPHTELLSEINCQSKRRKKWSLSHKDIEVTHVEETTETQPATGHLLLANEPIRDVSSNFCEHVLVDRKGATVEIPMETEDSPVFKHVGPSFLKRKKKKEIGATVKRLDLMHCDTNVDVSQNASSASQGDDITRLKMTHRGRRESCEVEDKGTSEEQMAESVSHSSKSADFLEISNLSVVTDSTVITKVKKKKQKLDKQEDKELVSGTRSVENVQSSQYAGLNHSESQTTELPSKRRKKNNKDKERNGTTNVKESSAVNKTSNETLDCIAYRPADLRVNDLNYFTETNELEQNSEENIGLPTVAIFKSMKKKKRKKTDGSEQYVSVDLDLDASSVSLFDEVTTLRVFAQQKSTTEEIIEERPHDDSAIEHLESNTAGINVAKHKRKSQNVSCSFQGDDIGLEKTVSDSQSGNTAELLEKTSNLYVVSDSTVTTTVKQKKKKKHKFKQQENAELDSDTHNVENVYSIESETSVLPSRTKKKKKDATISPSTENLEHVDHRPPEMRANDLVQSCEATEIHQLEHIETSEEIPGSPSVTTLKSAKKRKKKDRSEKHQGESVHLGLEVNSVSLFDDVIGLRAVEQEEDMDEIIEERPHDDRAIEHLESNTAGRLRVAKRKKKSRNVSCSFQGDDTGLEITVSDSQSGNTAELFEKSYLSVVSDSTVKQKKKKKHKLKEQENAELDSYTCTEEHFYSVESETSVLPSRRTKKKKKDAAFSPSKESLEHINHRPPEMRANDLVQSCEATEIHQLEHIETSWEIPGSPSVTTLKSAKKRKKKDRSEKHQGESVHLGLEVNSVSLFDDVIGLRAVEQEEDMDEIIEERPHDDRAIEHLESNTAGRLRVAKRKKKSRNVSCSFQGDDTGLEITVSDSQSGNTAELFEKSYISVVSDSTVKKKKKKKHKLKEQENAELDSDSHKVENVHSVESETSMSIEASRRTKKKRQSN
ncbi:phoenix isoform X2 [Myxocyprinus asiaticus]|uniref:phoenix isoform X2 n=1 Tax=Myxocyprinus asiaticus TaxID=70543 RepID=UPI00222209D2|nr:phoenix isoform X2 [Myxocyprinus asiaticus]